MCEISKREQLLEYMKRHGIDIAAIQETKIPQAAEERRKGYILLFSSSVAQGRENGEYVGATKKLSNPIEYNTHYIAVP